MASGRQDPASPKRTAPEGEIGRPNIYKNPGGERQGYWHRILDMALPEPDDIMPLGETLPAVLQTYRVGARSICMLVCGSWLELGTRSC